MIVKNEAPVIARCLASVRPLIDHWVIVDTGSTDGTQDLIREQLKDLPGTLYERPWKDFAHNRSESLRLARPHADFSLIIDADDTLEFPHGHELPFLTFDCYTLDIHDTPLRYPRKQLVSNRLHWFYQGVLHEFINSTEPHTVGELSIIMRRNHDGARRRTADTYARDAAILSKALKTEQDPLMRSRYTFYLAQSYRDCRQPQEALKYYLQRAELGGWEEEVYVSWLQAARLKEQLGAAEDEILDSYLAADRVSTTRVEALYGAARLCRVKGRYAQGYEVARRGLGRTFPAGSLFGEPWVYEVGLLDEFAICAYWTGRHGECLDACLKALDTGRLSGDELHRVVSNAQFALKHLTGELNLVPMASSI